MIDFLSNTNWISPQIDCLLFLQNIRLAHSDIIDKFFLSITIVGEFWLPTLICAIVYWCIDFRAGVYLFTLESFNVFITHFFKMIACVYRPWILDSRMNPSELAVPFATGYSFPSGHSAMSSSVLGGCAYLLRKRKITCLLIIGLILLIGFSRLWLGVHTPQDVVCGLTIGLILVFALNPLINWAEKDNKRYLYLLGIINVLVIVALIYITYFNTYRMDYVSGELLVSPQRQKYSTIIAYMYALGLINGCFLCRRFSPFNPKDESVKYRAVKGIIGTVLIIILLKFGLTYMIMNTICLKLMMPLVFVTGLIITFIYPVIFKKLSKF
jgi:membrane-associated phospholipid phosphatase